MHTRTHKFDWVEERRINQASKSSEKKMILGKLRANCILSAIVFNLLTILIIKQATKTSCHLTTLTTTTTTSSAQDDRQTLLANHQAKLNQINETIKSAQRLQNEAELLDYNLNLTQLLLFRFHHLFGFEASLTEQIQSSLVIGNLSDDNQTGLGGSVNNATASDLSPSDYSGKVQSLLENRKIDSDSGTSGRKESSSNGDQFQRRKFFKILNRVFSRVELPEVYPKSNVRQKSGHCGLHIGCIEEIPNFPSLLKKPNVSSSFTIYTGGVEGSSVRIPFEPILHHQLQDANSSELELEEKLKWRLQSQPAAQSSGNQRRKTTALSWRSAANIIHSQEFPFDLAQVEQSNFDSSQTTRIIVGGYFAKEDEEWIDEVVRQWLILEPKGNVIKVSWPEANRGLYHTAAYNSRIVGRQLTLFLYYLDQMFRLDLNKLHLVGHSLGAHIAGFVGADNEGRIARITGLDPAGPIFVELNSSMRLDASDAKFVDVLHTNGGSITKGALGLSTPSGHVDYYSNGGSLQPGCYFSSVTKSIMDPVERVACSHRRSYRYFIEIIKMTISGERDFMEAKLAGASSALEPLVDASQLLVSGSNSTTTREQLLLLLNSHQQLDRRTGELEPAGIGSSARRKSPTPNLPKAFLFEAKQDELVRLSQPEIVLLSPASIRREASTDLAPLKLALEFHLLNPDFPSGKRGMYFFKTRSEPPFFGSKQYALTFRTDSIVRRKMTLLAKVEQTLVAEVDIEEIPGIYSIAFTPNDAKLLEIGEDGRAPNLYLMWKHRSFNLLQLNQLNDLHLSSIELSLLDADEELDSGERSQPVVRYTATGVTGSTSGAAGQANNRIAKTDLTLHRNQWHKFEGRFSK